MKIHILSRFVGKHGRHRQFLFLIGRFLKEVFFSETAWLNVPKLSKKYQWNETTSIGIAYFIPIH